MEEYSIIVVLFSLPRENLVVFAPGGGKSTYKLFALFKKEVVPWLIHCISVSIAFGHILNLSPPPSAE